MNSSPCSSNLIEGQCGFWCKKYMIPKNRVWIEIDDIEVDVVSVNNGNCSKIVLKEPTSVPVVMQYMHNKGVYSYLQGQVERYMLEFTKSLNKRQTKLLSTRYKPTSYVGVSQIPPEWPLWAYRNAYVSEFANCDDFFPNKSFTSLKSKYRKSKSSRVISNRIDRMTSRQGYSLKGKIERESHAFKLRCRYLADKEASDSNESNIVSDDLKESNICTEDIGDLNFQGYMNLMKTLHETKVRDSLSLLPRNDDENYEQVLDSQVDDENDTRYPDEDDSMYDRYSCGTVRYNELD